MSVNRLAVIKEALQDPQPEVRAAAVKALERLTVRQSLPILEQQLVNGDCGQRVAATYALAELDCESSLRLLLAALKDVASDVRAVAVQGLAIRHSPQALPALIQALNDKEVAVAVYAAQALAGYQDRRLLAYLDVAARGADSELRSAIITTLGTLGFAESEAVISRYFDDPAPQVRAAAVQSLAELRPQ